jgi:hypothetical protein
MNQQKFRQAIIVLELKEEQIGLCRNTVHVLLTVGQFADAILCYLIRDSRQPRSSARRASATRF